MGKSLKKSLKVYIKEKIKKQAIPLANNAASAAGATITNAASRLVSTCRHPKTPSFSLNVNGPLTSFKAPSANHAATLSDVERFVFENFNSLFIQEEAQTRAQTQTQVMPAERPKYVDPPPSPPLEDTPPSKHYFVFSDGGRRTCKKSATQSSKSVESSSEKEHSETGDESVVAVRTLTNDPYTDFRQSMEEVVAMRRRCSLCGPVDWDFMEELLLCYLDMNEQSVHKYVLEAFSDLAVSVRRRRPATAAAAGERRKVREVVDL